MLTWEIQASEPYLELASQQALEAIWTHSMVGKSNPISVFYAVKIVPPPTSCLKSLCYTTLD